MTRADSIERAMSGASGSPLSRLQKQRICMLAERAWIAAGREHFDPAAAAANDPLALSASEALELWRHEEQQKACGLKHLTACSQREFPRLMAHFLGLLGRPESAWWAERAVMDPARQARARLERTFQEVSGVIERPAEYAAAIARSKFKTTDLASLSARQTWTLVFDLRRAAQKRRAHGRAV
jgi:hypothetical protein